jgi:hypothetical protein
VAGSERSREVRRRRHRKKKLGVFKRKIETATVSEKQHIAGKIRALTPGAETVIRALALEDR